MDDYGRRKQWNLHLALNEWMAVRGYSVLEIPTGQGFVIKRG